MSKIFNFYKDDIDKTWYNSSNVFYSECNDITDSFKVVKVVFKNGRTYQYSDVNVNDYLLFRESASQGQALTKYLKKYTTQRIDDSNIEELTNELNKLIDNVNKQSKAFDKYFIEINEKEESCTLSHEGKNIVVLSLKDTPFNILVNVCNALNINHEIILK